MEVKGNKLYLGGVSADDLAEGYGTPLYVYEEEKIREQYRKLFESLSWPKKRILYACKANTNIAVMQILKEEGCGIDAVSPGEVFIALKAGFKPEDILFTGNSVRDDEMDYVVKKGVLVNIDSLDQLERYGKMFPGTEISIRINPDVGAGYHSHIITGGPESKFGIYYDRVEEIKKISDRYNLEIIGVHSHIGSGILNIEDYIKAMKVVIKTARDFKNLEFVDFGGGIGIPYKPDEREIDIRGFGERASQLFSEFCREYGKELRLMLEPGKYLVGQAGFLLTRVNTLKETPKYRFVGTDTGFNHLIRPILYGAYHEIINGSNVDDAKVSVVIAGNVCESGEVLTRDEKGPVERRISRVRNGDILVICNAGAYGFSQASTYNSRPLPAEVLVKNGKPKLIRKRGRIEDLLKDQIY